MILPRNNKMSGMVGEMIEQLDENEKKIYDDIVKKGYGSSVVEKFLNEKYAEKEKSKGEYKKQK